MIRNSKQLTQYEKEREAMIALAEQYKDATDFMGRGQHGAIMCQIEDLELEINKYKKLIATPLEELTFDMDNIHEMITSLRIVLKLTQQQFADKIGVSEQQIQRYEEQDYQKASFERIIQMISETVGCVNISFAKQESKKNNLFADISLPPKVNRLKERGQLLKFAS